MKNNSENLLTFGEHLDVLRKMLFRIIIVLVVLFISIFCFKEDIFMLLLAPAKNDFCLYRWVEGISSILNVNFSFDEMDVRFISTELSSQFMVHITSSLYLALLLSSPYILYELFLFVSPALYDNERRYSVPILITVFILFAFGVLLSYFVLFPFSFRFLVSYQVDYMVENRITLVSYISTFATMTLLMGLVFQLPVISFILGKLGLITSYMLKECRKYAILLIAIIAAIITPPDIVTCILVMGPLYLLYEFSIWIVELVENKYQ